MVIPPHSNAADALPSAVAAPTSTVRVPLAERAYDVRVGPGLAEHLGEHVSSLFPPAGGRPNRAFLVYDAGLPDEHVVAASRSLAHQGFHVSAASVQPHEPQKTLGTLARLLVDLAESRHERGEPIIALGGGITGDVAGFLAAVYRRGVPFVQVPTTLLSMVDASVGGKTGVNLLTDSGLQKNVVGAFHQPSLVLADVRVLRTLPDRTLASGLAECLKTGLLSADFGDPGLFEWLQSSARRLIAREDAALAELITRCVAVKAAVVAGDEREQAPAEGVPHTGKPGRAVLNLGHTFAHAIETLPDLSPTSSSMDAPLQHGEAVALGLIAAASAGVSAGLTDLALPDRLRNALRTAGLPVAVTGLPANDDLVARMLHDKKVTGGMLRLVVPKGNGACVVVTNPPLAAVHAGLDAIRI